MATTPSTPDPFAAQGGGVFNPATGNWLPSDHPEALAMKNTAAQAGGTGTQAGGTGTQAGGTAVQATSVPQQASNAQTYSQAPGAAPTQTTTNQGTQDVVRNSYLQQATQGTQVDANDPNIRQQVTPFAAAVERQKRDYLGDQAEQAGPYATGAARGQARMAGERAGQAVGTFEADLIGRELQNRRAEIQNALTNLSGMISGDQARQLQQELADLNAELTRLGINTNARVAGDDLALRERLARLQDAYNYAALNQNQRQFSDTLGFNIGATEATLNQAALSSLFG
jgi:hypothetical protein